MISVNELTDVELNRAMVWLYPQKGITAVFNYEQGTYYNAGTGAVYEWLSDWNLTMPLAFENELCAQFDSVTKVIDFNNGYEREHQNPLRAICEVLVQIKLEQKQ